MVTGQLRPGHLPPVTYPPGIYSYKKHTLIGHLPPVLVINVPMVASIVFGSFVRQV